jgi:hypothetical protein
MRLTAVLGLVVLGWEAVVVGACAGSGHGRGSEEKVWTREELDDLERKWGTEVSPSCRVSVALAPPTLWVWSCCCHCLLYEDRPMKNGGHRTALLGRLTRLQWGFTGIGSFAHLKYVKCLTTPSEQFDIAIIGAPFDTAVSYRPGEHPPPCLLMMHSINQDDPSL